MTNTVINSSRTVLVVEDDTPTIIVSPVAFAPSAPTVSVNGHVGFHQTVTAHDVGAYTVAEAEEASIVNAILFG